jgi:hypothetical protein
MLYILFSFILPFVQIYAILCIFMHNRIVVLLEWGTGGGEGSGIGGGVSLSSKENFQKGYQQQSAMLGGDCAKGKNCDLG